jgi:hypothetical protein
MDLSRSKAFTANPMRQVPSPMACAASKIFWLASSASSFGEDESPCDPTMIIPI